MIQHGIQSHIDVERKCLYVFESIWQIRLGWHYFISCLQRCAWFKFWYIGNKSFNKSNHSLPIILTSFYLLIRGCAHLCIIIVHVLSSSLGYLQPCILYIQPCPTSKLLTRKFMGSHNNAIWWAENYFNFNNTN